MKIVKRLFLLVLIILIVAFVYNYPKLNVISGYSAKITSSSVFVGKRNLTLTDSTDTNFGPVALATDVVNRDENKASASVYGLKKRTAVYRGGLGSVLVNDDYDATKTYLTPKRSFKQLDSIPYPYGTGVPIDSVFESINYKLLTKAVNNCFDKGDENSLKTRAVLVLYKDHIIAEQYAPGFDKNSVLLGWSMTKSLVSTLYGILVSKGKLSVNDKAPVKEWANDERANITYDDLLKMSSGLVWDEDYGTISDVTNMLFLESDMSASQVNKEAIAKPGEVWNYSSGTSNLLSGLVRKEFNTHQEYLDFLYSDFVDKIGMHSMLIEADLSGNYIGSSYGWATARDWAKFGLLYLHNGMWNGDKIFNEDWVSYVNEPVADSKKRYGAHFWLNAGKRLPDVPESIYYADGFQGQRVFIVPTHDLVVVRLGLSNIDFNELLKDIIAAVE